MNSFKLLIILTFQVVIYVTAAGVHSFNILRAYHVLSLAYEIVVNKIDMIPVTQKSQILEKVSKYIKCYKV